MPSEPVALSQFADTIFKRTYAFDESETWEGCAARVAKFVANGDHDLEEKFRVAIASRKFIPGGRYLYAAGRPVAQTTNCFLFRAEDSREGWGRLLDKHVNVLSTGGGAGTYYGDIRASGTPIGRFGGTASGPISLMEMVNEVARHVMSGGKRRSALLASLPWYHDDIHDFINAKNWPMELKAAKERNFNAQAPLDMTNISIWLDPGFLKGLKKPDGPNWDLYLKAVRNMLKTGEPGFLMRSSNEDEQVLTNPCGETRSADDSDVCNLGSIVLPRVESLDELEELVRLATEFLYLGSFVSYVPHPSITPVREKNRRIGLGIMGLHEWLIKNDLSYEPNGKLGSWLSLWQKVSDETADKLAAKYNSARPAAVRAVAPTGTISICAETTSGIEPVFCVAYKRRFLGSDKKWKYSYVVDPTVERLRREHSIRPDDVEDAYSLALDVERRISMQAFVQDYVDMAISSTINVPEWGEEGNNNAKQFSRTLLKYLPRLKGITVYPDGARSGQPLVPVKYETAVKHQDVVFEESEERCIGGVCGA